MIQCSLSYLTNFNLSGLYDHIKHCFSFDELWGSINLRKITLDTIILTNKHIKPAFPKPAVNDAFDAAYKIFYAVMLETNIGKRLQDTVVSISLNQMGTLAFESTGPCYKYLEIYPAPAEHNILLDMTENLGGTYFFYVSYPGEHVICMYSNSTAWFSGAQLRVHLDMQVGKHAIDYASVAQREKLNELQLRIRQLLDQVEQRTKLSTLSGGEIPSYQ
uniref:GOLD domain-containing protein n=1 Tax=Glossina palpalis gambiensis TaxID=67801 RepID=A0A1B0BYP7_9MUSC